MKDRPTDDERIIEALEACRPGRHDLDDPAMAGLAEQLAADPQLAEIADRLQGTDMAIAGAFGEVPVPEGLEKRLLARLARAEEEQPTATDDVATEESSEKPIPGGATPSKRRSRRRLAIAGTVATITVGLLVAVGFWLFRSEDLTRGDVLNGGIAFFRNDSLGPGKPMAEAPNRFPISGTVRCPQGTTWRWIEGFLDHDGVAYDLSGNARLYVIRHTVRNLRQTTPPPNPLFDTGYWRVSAWREGNVLYVLVVKGSAEDYRRFVDIPPGDIT